MKYQDDKEDVVPPLSLEQIANLITKKFSILQFKLQAQAARLKTNCVEENDDMGATIFAISGIIQEFKYIDYKYLDETEINKLMAFTNTVCNYWNGYVAYKNNPAEQSNQNNLLARTTELTDKYNDIESSFKKPKYSSLKLYSAQLLGLAMIMGGMVAACTANLFTGFTLILTGFIVACAAGKKLNTNDHKESRLNAISPNVNKLTNLSQSLFQSQKETKENNCDSQVVVPKLYPAC